MKNNSTNTQHTELSILTDFFKKHGDVEMNELLEIAEALRYYRRLNGKTLDEIRVKTSYKRLCEVASELEIPKYKTHNVDVLRTMIIDKFNSVFSRQCVRR